MLKSITKTNTNKKEKTNGKHFRNYRICGLCPCYSRNRNFFLQEIQEHERLLYRRAAARKLDNGYFSPGFGYGRLAADEAEISSRRTQKQKAEKEKNFLLQYFLQTYLYSGNEEVLKKAGEILDESNWEQWHCAILIESDKAFFDNVPDNIDEELMQGLHRNFFYLNLNTRQSVLFFSDVYCDYQLVAKHLYDILKQNYSASFHLAVSSRFEGHEALPEIMSQLEQTMEEKFYHPDVHVFNNEASDSQPVNAETQDSRLMEKISEDISRKDVEQLKKHFECLVKKYENDTRFSAMYVKFVFSNVIQELFQENQFSEERKLDHEVERLYSCTNLKQILAITQENISLPRSRLSTSFSSA